MAGPITHHRMSPADNAGAPSEQGPASQGMDGAKQLGEWKDAATPAPIRMTAADTTGPALDNIDFTSDGSVEEAACEAAQGAYGWVARCGSSKDGWGDFTTLLPGAGRVPGKWWGTLLSTC